MTTKKEKTEIIVSPSFFAICTELATIKTKLDTNEGELEDGDFEALQKWEAAVPDKAENICHFDARLDSDIEYFQAIEKKAAAIRKSKENAKARLRKYLASCMASAGLKSIKKDGGVFSVTLVEGRVSPQIDDVNKLPIELVKIVEVVTPDKAAVKAALEAGKEIPGAHLEKGESYLQIR